MNAINNDRKHLKNLKFLSKHKNNSIKTLSKRKSSRRVLNDHFNIEENHRNVINKDIMSTKSLKPMKLKVKTNKKFENKLKSKAMKKKISKRKVELSVTTDMTLNANNSQTSVKEQKTTDKSVVSELNDILSDDNTTDKNQKKNSEKVEKTVHTFNSLENKNKKTEKAIRKMTKRNDPNIDLLNDNLVENNAISDDISDDIIIYPNDDKIETKDEKQLNTNKDLDDWLRREFYENMAKTMATMRKKRSGNSLKDESDVINAIEDSEALADNIIAVDEDTEDNDNKDEESRNVGQFTDDSDNDYVIAALDDDIKDKLFANDVNDESDGRDDRNDFIDWENAKENVNSIKTKRSVPAYFGDLQENEESNEIDSKRFSRVYDNLESIEDSLLNEALDLIRETAAKGSQSEVISNKNWEQTRRRL